MRPFIAPILLALALAPASTAGDGPEGDEAVRDRMLVTTGWLADALGEEGLVVVAVGKEPDGYAAGHVPGARFLSTGAIGVEVDGVPNRFPGVEALTEVVRALGIGGEDQVVLYDDAGGVLAARAYVAFELVGHGERTAVLDGGWRKWTAEGHPASTGEAPAVARSDFEARPKLEILTSTEELEHMLADKRIHLVLIDARSAAEYSGQEAGAGIDRPGHLPGAVQVEWTEHLTGGDVPVLRPAAELRQLYGADAACRVDLTEAHLVATYCRTGMKASHTYFVLKYLGHDPILYDGSFIEWSADPTRKVEK